MNTAVILATVIGASAMIFGEASVLKAQWKFSQLGALRRVAANEHGVPASPQNVEVSPSDSASLLVSWEPPLAGNQKISGYNVYWTAADDGSTGSVSVNGNALSANVTGLTACSNYTVFVTAVNTGSGKSIGGEGPKSDTILGSSGPESGRKQCGALPGCGPDEQGIYVGARCYYFESAYYDWSGATARCYQKNAITVMFQTYEEQDFKDLLEYIGDDMYWIGGTDYESDWRWSNGQDVMITFENFSTNDGCDRQTEQCCLYMGNGVGRSHDCYDNLKSVCEFSLTPFVTPDG